MSPCNPVEKSRAQVRDDEDSEGNSDRAVMGTQCVSKVPCSHPIYSERRIMADAKNAFSDVGASFSHDHEVQVLPPQKHISFYSHMPFFHMETRWRRWLFYVDVLIIVIFALATVYMAKDAYWAGFYRNPDHFDINAHSRALWHLARDVAFQVASLAWIFYRLFHCQLLLLKKP